ncbi:Outer membrane vitamin B12 receptor BtuB [hydrothermal vent metagenome]|uniref:Outer membrane vitamin B12 receptor BtuB n=1 Tax=hydrothermal vent metagenome TaxID=652676 RepID=A0A1W1CAL4_9ZZZZ
MKTNTIKKTSLALSIALTTTLTNAVIGPIPIYNKTEFRTNQVVVNGIASKVVLNKQQIVDSGANSFLELLATIPSVNLFYTSGNTPSVFLRGTESHHTILLVDGIRVMDSSTPEGTPNLNAIPFAQIEKIEIIKGPFSSLYGSGAVGGVIQIFTKKGGKKEGEFDLSTIYGTHNSKNHNATYAVTNGPLSLNFALNEYSTDGINARTNDTSGETDGEYSNSQSLNIAYQISKKTKLNINHLEKKSTVEYDDSFGNSHNRHLDNAFRQFAVKLESKLSENWNTLVSISKNSQKRDAYNNNVFSFGGNVTTKEYTWLNDIKFKQSILSLGLTKIKDIDNDDNVSLSSDDIFGQYQYKLNDKNDILIGFRQIKHTKFGNNKTYNLGWGFQVNKKLKLSASYGTAFKAPVFDQLYNTAFTIGNKNLNPEKSKSYEIGIDYQTPLGKVIANIYKTKITDDILYTFGANPNYSNSNIDVISKGLDLSLIFNPIKKWNISANYYYNDAKQDTNNATQLSRRPKETYKITANRQFKKLNVNIEWIKKGDYLDGTTEIDSYNLVNVSTNYQLKKDWKIIAKANNVFDKDYIVANRYNQDGANYYLGLHYNF